MSINGEEVTSDNLIDNDVATCELLPVGDGCRMDKVKSSLHDEENRPGTPFSQSNGPSVLV